MKHQSIRIIYIIGFLIFSNYSYGQSEAHIYGHVVCEGEHIPYVNIILKGSNKGGATDFSGHYFISDVPPGKHILKFQGLGYISKEVEFEIAANQTLEIDFEVEREKILLEQVIITGSMKEVSLKDSPVKVEVISSGFLKRMPSNNIIEAIEMVNGLQNCSDCSVCGTTGIHINGMPSNSTAVLIDGMPIMGSLASVYGLNGIPTDLIDRIEVIKGPSSTLYGSEAVAGVINVITKRPERVPSFSYNFFMSADGEKNIDFTLVPFKTGKINTLIGGNIYSMDYFNDDNKDGFADMVMIRPRISIFNKWSFQKKDKRVLDIALKAYHENRFGGTQPFLGNYSWNRHDDIRGNDSIYGETVFTDRLEMIGSYLLPLKKENLRLDFSQSYHHQDAWYADSEYKALQNISFAQLIWDKKINRRQDLILGSSIRYQTYEDNTDVIQDKEIQFIPGIFAQHEYKVSNKFNFLSGLRMDNHKAHGNILSPRLSAKWNPDELSTIRFNSGTGFRIINLFSEEHAAYHGFRELVIEEKIRPEQSYNATLSFNRLIVKNETVWTLDIDGFYTYYKDKIIADYDTDPTKIIYSNIKNGEYAVSRGVSASIQASFTFPFSINAGFTRQDVYLVETNENNIKMKHPIVKVPDFLGVYSAEYLFKKNSIRVNVSGNAYGKMKMPLFPEPFKRPEYSKPYMVHNIQFKKSMSKNNLHLYFAIKNIFNYKQGTPLINPQNPFAETFDTSYVYAPITGRRYIAGLRFNIL